MSGEAKRETMFLIPGQLAQEIINFLVQHPYAHVHKLIEGLQKIEPVKEPAAPGSQ
jgi:hypothetical protein